MGTLTRDQILFEAGRSDVHARDAGTREYQAHVRRLHESAAQDRETQMILDGSRRASGQAPRRDPEMPTKVRVLQSFTLAGGAIAAVDSIVELPLHLAQSLAGIGRCEII
jgi:hypothetical protein